MQQPLIVLTGPTAVGKTALSIRLAKAVDGEIISADSMQVYRGMDIGTAKIRQEEMDGVPHHLIDILSPDEEFNVAVFQKRTKEAIAQIYRRGHIPIITGGTGFYIQSVIYDIKFEEENGDRSYRTHLEEMAAQRGGAYLHEQLRLIDPASAEAIHENNVKRVIRALEYYHETGSPISLHNKQEREKTSPYQLAYFVLNLNRRLLYERIDKRVDKMLSDGLVNEVRGLYEQGFQTDLVSMQGLGYKEVLSYLKGEMTLEEAVYILKRDTRHFAKRQLTWFKREKDVIWMEKDCYDGEDAVLDAMLLCLKEKHIL